MYVTEFYTKVNKFTDPRGQLNIATSHGSFFLEIQCAAPSLPQYVGQGWWMVQLPWKQQMATPAVACTSKFEH